MAAKNGTYVIGCKLPNGLIIRGAGKQFRLNGSRSSLIVGGFGLTEDVPAEIWDEFEKVNKQGNIIKNGVVFAVGDKESAKSAATERKAVKTGLEQLDPKKTDTKPDEE